MTAGMDNATLQVMIVGAGSAGLLLAQALKKANVACIVFEQDTSIDARPRDWDFGIYWAQSPLKECLPEELVAMIPAAQVDNHVPTEHDFIPMHNGETGERLSVLPTPLALRLGRRRFIRVLSTGIDIRYGKHISKITSNSSKVAAHFDDGTQHTADLLIGCEGAHSPTREFLVGPDKATLSPSPVVASITIAKLPPSSVELFQKLHYRACIWFHPDGVFSWCGVHESREGPNLEDWEFMMMQTWIQEEPVHLSGDEILADFKLRAANHAEPYRTIYQSIPDGTRVWHNRLSYWRPIPWDNMGGTVTLAGDSAHPMTFHRGQGLNNAVSDVAAFYRKITASYPITRESLTTAVNEYEKELWERGLVAVDGGNENTLAIHNWETLRQSPIFRYGTREKVGEPVNGASPAQ